MAGTFHASLRQIARLVFNSTDNAIETTKGYLDVISIANELVIKNNINYDEVRVVQVNGIAQIEYYLNDAFVKTVEITFTSQTNWTIKLINALLITEDGDFITTEDGNVLTEE